MAIFIWAVPTVTITVAVFFLGYPTASNAVCTYVEYTSDKCRKEVDHIYVEGPPGKYVYKNCFWSSEILLSNPKTEVAWYCESDKERTAWKSPANKLRVSFCGDTIKWWIYKCEVCTHLGETRDWCRGASYITVEYQTIYKGTYNRIVKLPGYQSQVHWKCGTSNERAGWGPHANQLRINYFSDGRIQWKIERCG